MPGIDQYTKLMLHCNGADASTTFTDDSDTPHTMTAIDNAQLDTAQKKFGTASGLFDGTDDEVTTPDHADWNFGSGDFTVDCWVRFNTDAEAGFVQQREDTGNFWVLGYTGSELFFQVYSGTVKIIEVLGAAWSPGTGTWFHVAIIRTGNDWKLFIDGVQTGGTASDSDAIPDFNGELVVGSYTTWFGAEMDLDGWLDEVRVSNGIARWTANFTPPTSEYSVPVIGNALFFGANF